jgi:hypothetical protein
MAVLAQIETALAVEPIGVARGPVGIHMSELHDSPLERARHRAATARPA